MSEPAAETAPAPSIGSLAKALAAFQAEMPTVPKSHTATVRSDKGNYSYTYAGLADVTEAAMPLLSKHGLAFSTLPRSGHLVGMLMHESGESLTASLPINGSTPQQVGSSLTYMRRYLFGCMTGLVTDDDDDGQLAQKAVKRPAKKATAPPTTTTESPLLDTKGDLARAMFAALGKAGIPEEERLEQTGLIIGRPITSSKEMTDAEAHMVLDHLAKQGAPA